jgi:hypothetical protein
MLPALSHLAHDNAHFEIKETKDKEAAFALPKRSR